MHGLSCIFWANLTPFSLSAAPEITAEPAELRQYTLAQTLATAEFWLVIVALFFSAGSGSRGTYRHYHAPLHIFYTESPRKYARRCMNDSMAHG
jgi:hypothetical protein